MKWQWVILLAGLGLYVLVLVPGFLPHTSDSVVALVAGVTLATVAVFGFDTNHVSRRLAALMIIVSLIMFSAGIVLARQGHPYVQLALSVPATGLGFFGARMLIDKRKKND